MIFYFPLYALFSSDDDDDESDDDVYYYVSEVHSIHKIWILGS